MAAKNKKSVINSTISLDPPTVAPGNGAITLKGIITTGFGGAMTVIAYLHRNNTGTQLTPGWSGTVSDWQIDNAVIMPPLTAKEFVSVVLYDELGNGVAQNGAVISPH
jgi:hypothetical protein